MEIDCSNYGVHQSRGERNQLTNTLRNVRSEQQDSQSEQNWNYPEATCVKSKDIVTSKVVLHKEIIHRSPHCLS
jgi:hypothetical protein